MSTDPPLLPPIQAITPIHAPIHGEHVKLTPLSPADAPSLYKTLGGPNQTAIWRFLPDGPYTDLEAFTSYITTKSQSTDPLFFTINHPTHGPVGHTTFMRITPAHRTLELGFIIYSSLVHRSILTTETIYLMLKMAFDEWGYRRVEWKCDNRNEPSKAAARRFGFTFEGVFRQHMIVKGMNRDSAWFAMLDGEWEGGIRAGFEKWLAKENFDEEGRQRRRLEECRADRR